MAPRRRRGGLNIDVDLGDVAEVLTDRAFQFFDRVRENTFEQQARALPADTMFKCVGKCGPNNTVRVFPLSEMRQIDPHPENQGWGTCKNCWEFIWKAGQEKSMAFVQAARKQAAARSAAGAAPPPPRAATPPPVPKRKSAFEVLELPVDGSATDEQVKKAYHRLAAIYHPDSCPPGTPTDEVMASKEKFLEIQRAYEVIRRIRSAPT